VPLGVRVEIELEGAETADDVLRRVGAVDTEHELLRPPLDELALRGPDVIAAGQVVASKAS